MSHNPVTDCFNSLILSLVGPKVKRIHAGLGVMVHSCHFLTGVIAKTSSAQKRSRTTSEIMWSVGLPGHRTTNWASSAWKISFSSLDVLWSHHGPLLHSMITQLACQRMLPRYPWTPKSSITVGHSFFGATFVEM